MRLAWQRVGAGYYRAQTGRRTFVVRRPDFAPQWVVRVNGIHVGLASTLADGKRLAQTRENQYVSPKEGR